MEKFVISFDAAPPLSLVLVVFLTANGRGGGGGRRVWSGSKVESECRVSAKNKYSSHRHNQADQIICFPYLVWNVRWNDKIIN